MNSEFKTQPAPSANYVEEVFGADGILAQTFEGYSPRAGQIAMAEAVKEAIATEQHAMIEAPTGTGKSLAYLVPAVYQAVSENKRVVICTANIALQEQLVDKDLPLLADILPVPFTYALRKGIGNYLCKLSHDEENFQLDAFGSTPERDALLRWALDTVTGDKSDLDFEPDGKLWAKFSSSADDCLGSKCDFAGSCFARRAQAAAREADVIVCNYHVLFIDLALKDATDGYASILGDYDVVIMDEAHKAPDIARDVFGVRLAPGRPRWALGLLNQFGEDELKDKATTALKKWFNALDAYEASDAYKIRLKRPNFIDAELTADVVKKLTWAVDIYKKEHHLLRKTGDESKKTKRMLSKIEQRQNALLKFLTDFKLCAELADSEHNVYFIERSGRGCNLLSKRIFVADVFETLILDVFPTVIFTSATLSTGGRFDYFRNEVGFYEGGIELEVETPFDFANNVLLILPDMPAPNETEFRDEMASVFETVIEKVKGRTLGLFTSYRNLNEVGERLDGCEYTIARQGEKPRMKLVEDFKADENSVLLGTESFWAGVDVPGPALSCVVIDRLPFAHYEDPIMDAIRETNKNWFFEYSVPKAIIAFKQGFGRLIRRVDDYGVVVLLDNRVKTKSYGGSFLRALPKTWRAADLDKIDGFFAWKGEG